MCFDKSVPALFSCVLVGRVPNPVTRDAHHPFSKRPFLPHSQIQIFTLSKASTMPLVAMLRTLILLLATLLVARAQLQLTQVGSGFSRPLLILDDPVPSGKRKFVVEQVCDHSAESFRLPFRYSSWVSESYPLLIFVHPYGCFSSPLLSRS
jgi:hypothetical protein